MRKITYILFGFLLAASSTLVADQIIGDNGFIENLSESVADTLYCKLTGCTMTGELVQNSIITQTYTMDDATGDEHAYKMDYTVNKATSGNDIGLLLEKTDTNSPGFSILIYALVDAVEKFYLLDDGQLYTAGKLQLGADLQFNGGGEIVTTVNGDLTMNPNGTGDIDIRALTQVGDGAYSWDNAPTSLGTEGSAEFDGRIYGDGGYQGDLFSSDGTQGVTNSSNYWLCTAADCATRCQVEIKDGLIVGCS